MICFNTSFPKICEVLIINYYTYLIAKMQVISDVVASKKFIFLKLLIATKLLKTFEFKVILNMTM